MKVFENDKAIVTKGFFTGFRFTVKENGRVIKPTSWLKSHMGAVHSGLKQRGLDAINDAKVSAAFWEYFVDLGLSPPNGLLHRAVASSPLEGELDAIERSLTNF